MSSLKIGFIGAGNMAQALAKGIISSGAAKASNITASSPPSDQPLLDQMQSMGCRITHSNTEAAHDTDVTILAVKPNVMGRVLNDIRDCVTPGGPLVASIAMGVPLSTLEQWLVSGCRVMRCMPNTPALVQQGVSVYCKGSAATDQDSQVTKQLLASVGDCHEVPEAYLNAVTGLSGAGPAYVYIMAEALADGGVQAGLPRPLAMSLAAKTLMGGAQMLLQTNTHPGVLKDAVCSPGGCTIKGVAALEAGGVRSALINAVLEATKRSCEMEN